ncbi:MAG: RagB/SusD family nutrient uptake outer membrane protein [Salinibacter sp.]
MKRVASLFLCSLLAVAVVSCDTNLNKQNPNDLTKKQFFQNTTQARTGLFGVYDALQQRNLWGRIQPFALDLLSEEAKGTASLIGPKTAVGTRTFGPTNGTVNQLWNTLYLGVKRANTVLERVPPNADNISGSDRIVAEARFLRALFYYQLVSLWGDVPLIEEVKEDPGGEPTASVDEIYTLIEEDLEAAAQNLPNKSSISGNMKGRAPKGAAYALEGRAHLMQKDWNKAREAFQKVIDSGEYQLFDDYFANFRKASENGKESIFEVQFTSKSAGSVWSTPNTVDYSLQRQEYGFLDWNNVVASEKLRNEYESNDPRKDMSFYQTCDTFNKGQSVVLPGNDQHPDSTAYACGVSDSEAANMSGKGKSHPSWRKYTNYYETNKHPCCASGINANVFRYAEVFIGLAEAQVELGNRTTSGNGSMSAAAALNKVRSRPSVDMPDISTVFTMSGKQGALDAVYHEYASELAGEQVLIYALLRRMDRYRDWAGDESGRVNRYFPIPQSEIDANPKIDPSDQNDGY